MEDVAGATEGMTRRTLIKRGAVVGGTLIWAAPVVDSFVSPAFGQQQGTPTPGVCCRFTGGGGPNGDAELVTTPSPNTPVHFGFELHCGPVPAEPNRLTISFQKGSDRVTFHLDGADRGGTYEATCFPPPTTTPDAPCSRIVGSGTGRTTGPGTTSGAAFVRFDIVDLGPESTDDDSITFSIDYIDEHGVSQTFTVTGNPTGNNQAHRPTGSKADCG